MPDIATSPESAFTICRCGSVVLTRTWIHGTPGIPPHWQSLPLPVSPVLGEVHHCPEIKP